MAAAIAHLGRAEGTGRSVRTPCAFPWPEGGNCGPLGGALVEEKGAIGALFLEV